MEKYFNFYYFFYFLMLIGYIGVTFQAIDLKSKIIGILLALVNAIVFYK